MRKFLLWDHDGVLVDSEKWYFLATQECLRALGVELDQATYLSYMAYGRPCWELARMQGIPDAAIAQAKEERDRLYQHYLATEDIEVEGVLEVLKGLQGRYRTAIVSTAKRADFEVIHRSRQIVPLFEFVITLEDCVRAKPDPDPYRQALRRFGGSAAEALAIEDSARGLRAAVAAGVDCIVVRNEFTAAQDFTGAWRIIGSLRELPAALTG